MKNATTNTFELSATPGGSSISLGTTVTTPSGTFTLTGDQQLTPIVDLHTSTGIQQLRIDLTSFNSGVQPQTITGPGGSSLSVLTASGGDGNSGGSAQGSAGGFVGVGTNTANVTDSPTVNASVTTGAFEAGSDVTIRSSVSTFASVNSTNGAAGFVGIGHSDDSVTENTTSSAFVGNPGSPSQIVTSGNFTLQALTLNQGFAYNKANAGGGIGIANAESATINVGYSTLATVNDHSGVLAAGNVLIAADSKTNGTSTARATGGGFGADAHSEADYYVNNSPTTVEIGDHATVLGDATRLVATISQMTISADSRSDGYGFYSEGIDHANVSVTAPISVLIDDSAAVTGWEGVDLIARYDGGNTSAHSFARSTGLFGYVSGNANNTTNESTMVSGAPHALITAGARDPANTFLAQPSGFDNLTLFVDTTLGATHVVNSSGDSSKRSLAAGGDNGGDGRHENIQQTIPFSSDVNVLGPTLRLFVDGGGNITQAVGITVGAGHQTSGHVAGSVIVVNDIGNTTGSQVYFHSEGGGPPCSGGGTICGSGGTWSFSDTLARVLITNLSSLDLQLNNMSVFNATVVPLVTLSAPVVTLTFHITRTSGPTLIDVENLSSSDVLINGLIDNPIGTTKIHDTGGDILSTKARDLTETDPHASLIRTSVIDLEATLGAIGGTIKVPVDIVYSTKAPAPIPFKTSQVTGLTSTIFIGPTQLYTGELVKYTTSGTPIGGLTNGAFYTVVVSGATVRLDTPGGPLVTLDPSVSPLSTVHFLTPIVPFRAVAGADVNLDVKGRERDSSVVDVTVIVDDVHAGGDANILMQPTVRETDVLSTSGGVRVKWPVVPAGELDYNFFTPDFGSPPLLDAGIAATGATPGASTYDFRALDSAGNRTEPGVTAGGNITITAAQPNPGDPRINVLAITDILALGHVDILTNGWIKETEKHGDLRVGLIQSTDDDVTLWSPRRLIE